jgi:crossover junction endodeoxyribonuclease RuvC
MIILGVDPGTLFTGYGIIEKKDGRVLLLDVGVIKNPSKSSMPLRLRKIYTSLCTVIQQFHPDEFAIETAFYSNNAQSALKIGQARGVAILAGANFEIPVTEYSPREVKKAVVGSGAASKRQVQYMVMKLFHLQDPPKPLDATDAIAVAMCHSNRISRPRTGFKNWKSYIESHPERIVHATRGIKKRM